jgi:flagellar basal-body rod protein FlgG
MSRALYIAATGMKAQQINLDVISNNLANVNTTGFKRGRADFEDLLYQTLRPVGASATANTEVPTGIYLGLGSRPVSTSKIFDQGSAKFTDNWNDIAVEGEGFFQVEMPDGTTAYTRAGAFQVNSQGTLTTPNGDPVTPTITIPPNAIQESISVGQDGTITYRMGGTTAPATAGQLQLAQFVNPAGLESIGSNMFAESSTSGPPQAGIPGQNGLGKTVGGTLEMSNVNMVDELVNMIVGQRAYEINSKAIGTADQMLETAVNVKR